MLLLPPKIKNTQGNKKSQIVKMINQRIGVYIFSRLDMYIEIRTETAIAERINIKAGLSF